MAKNIVILFDGTSNEISENRTNVLRLYGTLQKSTDQLVWYDPGVGTFGADDAWLRYKRKAAEIWGMLTGWGLDENVKQAYRFLVKNYHGGTRNGEERDQIYLFGFSRGAYSARVLAGFLHAFGLIEPRNLNLVGYAYRAYKRIGEGGENKDNAFAEIRLFERILAPDRPPIRLLGLFDTVPSVIEHGRTGPRLRSHAFTKTNKSVQYVRHAVAIDERRVMFQPQLWPEGQEYWGNPFNKSGAKPQDAREVWFTGVHGDVGGGYPEAQSQLAKIPLLWMIEQTKKLGLKFVQRTINDIVAGKNPNKPRYVAPDPLAEKHSSMNPAWAVLEFIPSRKHQQSRRPSILGISIHFSERRPIPEGARVHQSVIDRAKTKGSPTNLPSEYQVEK
jgi:uncharacterized protein (DUF2235 family)